MSEINVTQDLSVRVAPVNNPNIYNKYGEQQGYYIAFVTGERDWEQQIYAAEQEWMRGIVPSNVGSGSAGSPVAAIELALRDYEQKFLDGNMCVKKSENIRW